jgi:putative ABC transport system substrate-binding protein
LKRREFITLLGGAATWPLAARAQEPAVPVVGFLRSSRVEDLLICRKQCARACVKAVTRWAAMSPWGDDQTDRLPALVDELVRKPVAVIVANGVAVASVKSWTAG